MVDKQVFDSLGLDVNLLLFKSLREGLTIKSRMLDLLHQDGNSFDFNVKVRIDTPQEVEYYQNGGILHYVLRQLAS